MEIAEVIKNHMTMDVAFGYSDFFLASWEKLQDATKDYLVEKTKKNKKILKRELEIVRSS